MVVWLPATTKAKLVRQVLLQKEGFIQVPCDLGAWWTLVSKTISPSFFKSSPEDIFCLLLMREGERQRETERERERATEASV